MKRTLSIFLGLIGLFVAWLILAGDGVWSLLGTHRLDISGTATVYTEIQDEQNGWSAYGGDERGTRYSTLQQITPENIQELEIAWSFSTGDQTTRPADVLKRMAPESTPIIVGDALVFCTAVNELIALNPASGVLRWRYDSEINLDQRPANQFVCRGIAQRKNNDGGSTVFMGTNDGRLVAVDGETGSPRSGFGDNGVVVLDVEKDLLWPGEFQITSPPVVAGDLIIVGSAIGDNARVEAPSGAVRAYDADTGALRWTFDPIPRSPMSSNATDWQGGLPSEGHANAWAPMSVDIERRLVFVPTSSPSPDFYGGLRPGDNRYSNSIVALDFTTGEVRWAFQTVHHDVWDYDLPAQPGLYTLTVGETQRDVVAQATKTGFIFVLDRETGEPVFEEQEVPVPANPEGYDVIGEALSPTQPIPTRPAALIPQSVAPRDAWGLTAIDKMICRRKIRAADNFGLFTPPTTRGMLMVPFTGGGANWGGTAFDPERNLVIVNMSNMAHHIQLIPEANIEAMREVFHDSELSPQTGAPYGMKRETLLSPLGLPCTRPPWGIIAAVDISTGEIVWRKTLGTTEDLTDGAVSLKLGTPNVGGPIVTKGGLVFIGAAMDDYLRAFDVKTGQEVWKGRLPGGGQATPMTYEWNDRQFVVIFAGGQPRMGTRTSDEIVAFALPD